VQTGVTLLISLVLVMIVSWYQFAVFDSDDTADDSTVSSDHEIINELNEEQDWWQYQKITWLLIGMKCVSVCVCVCVCVSLVVV